MVFSIGNKDKLRNRNVTLAYDELFAFLELFQVKGKMGFRFVYIDPDHDSITNHIFDHVNCFERQNGFHWLKGLTAECAENAE